jgi:hypothetical protein
METFYYHVLYYVISNSNNKDLNSLCLGLVKQVGTTGWSCLTRHFLWVGLRFLARYLKLAHPI